MVKSPYLKFSTQSEKIWKGLSHRERHILQAVFKSSDRPKMSVTDVISFREYGSPATLHAVLTRLVVANYLELSHPKIDSRLKLVKLTPKSQALFHKLEKLIKECAKD